MNYHVFCTEEKDENELPFPASVVIRVDYDGTPVAEAFIGNIANLRPDQWRDITSLSADYTMDVDKHTLTHSEGRLIIDGEFFTIYVAITDQFREDFAKVGAQIVEYLTQ